MFPLRKGSPPPDSQRQSATLFSQPEMIPPPQDQAQKDSDKNRGCNLWRFLCYLLHAFLFVPHIILLGFAASHHAERRVIIQYDIQTFIVGLSGGLQAFYTLYTALLVFVTQRLMLSTIFSTPKKLTQIHDICGACAGLGAALRVLWQQTKVASSALSIALVAVYFTCISVLHITSSTLIQVQLFNDTTTSMEPVTATWPNASVDLTSLDWSAVTTRSPFLQSLYGNTTKGLANNTLYDIPLPDFSSATVQATTVNAQCGLLTNLSITEYDAYGLWNISASMSDLGLISIMITHPPLLNEVWTTSSFVCLTPICTNLTLFLVTTEMEVDPSVGINHVYINGSYESSDGITQNFSSPIYLVACSFNATNHTVILDSSGIPPDTVRQQTNVAWSTFSSSGGLKLTSGIYSAMLSTSSLALTNYCQAIMYTQPWVNFTAFDVYMNSLLGMPITSCNGASFAQYTNTYLLTRDKVESTISQIAAQFIWLAGELGEAGGGFDRQMDEALVALSTTQQWRLNINILSVIFALCASVILLILAICVLWRHHAALVSGAGVLEIMWFGSRSRVSRVHLNDIQIPSLDHLRASSMFEAVFWTPLRSKREENSNLYAVIPLLDVETRTNSRSRSISGSETSNPRLGKLSQRILLRAANVFRGVRHWCYALHIVLVALHIALLALLVHHPEHSVVITNQTSVLTVGLSAFLQGIYTLYSMVLVLLMQRLASLKLVSERQKLTTVHDVSGAWTGIGAAIYILWQQRKLSSSMLQITAVAVYLALMLVLHITSSSIMQWQAFDGMLVGVIQTNLALPGDAVNISQLEWINLSPIALSVSQATQDPGLITFGLLNNTLYDVPQTPNNVTFTSASVNATIFTAQCGLVPNLTLSTDAPLGGFLINFQNGSNNGSFFEFPIWKDVVQGITSTECIACPQTVFYMITTGIDADESVLDPVVKFNWTYTPSGGNPQNSTTLAYVAACSLNPQTISAPLSLQYDALQISPAQMMFANESTSWPVWSPGDATNLTVGLATALYPGYFKPITMFTQPNSSASFSDMDTYIMSLLGLNLTSANVMSATQSSANPSVTLSPWQLENAVAQTAARFLWLAGQLGESGGGFQRSVGESLAMSDIVQWRLHLNTIPVIVASVASFLSLVFAIAIVGRGPSRGHPLSISGTSVLECLWAEAQSESLHARLETIEEPRLDKLRAGGMFEVCLGDIRRSSYLETERLVPELADD